MSTTRQQFTRGALVAFALHVGAMATALGVQLVHTNWLTQEAYGVFAQAMAALVIAGNVATLGVPSTFLQQLSNMLATGDHARFHGLVRWGLRRSGLAAGIGAAFGLTVALATDRDPAWALASLALPALTLVLLHQSVALGHKDVVLARLPSEVLRPAGGLLVFLALAGAGMADAWTAMLGVLVATVVTLLALAVGTARRAPPAAAPDVDARAWSRTSNQFLGLAIFHIGMDRADILVVGALAGAKSAALYAVATGLGKFLLFALAAVNTIAAPMVSDLHAQGRRDEVQDVLRTGVGAATALAVFGCLGLGLFAEHALAWFGPEYRQAVSALLLLLPGYLVNAACGSAGLVVSMTGHQQLTSRVIAVAGVAMVLLDLALVPGFGIEGAAAVRSLTMIGWNLALGTWAARHLGYDPTLVSWLRSSR